MGKSDLDPFMFGEDELAEWWDRARCKDHPHADYWFGDTKSTAEEQTYARTICAGCPVSAECMKYAMDHPELEGIWAGMDYKQRRFIFKHGRPRRSSHCHKGHDLEVHGTTRTDHYSSRRCRLCDTERSKARWAARKEAS